MPPAAVDDVFVFCCVFRLWSWRRGAFINYLSITLMVYFCAGQKRWKRTRWSCIMILHDLSFSLYVFRFFFQFVLHKLLILKFACIFFFRSFLRKSKWIMLKFDQKRIYLLYLFFVEIKLIKKDELNVNKQTNKHVLMLDFHSLNTAVMWKLKYLCKKYLLKCI